MFTYVFNQFKMRPFNYSFNISELEMLKDTFEVAIKISKVNGTEDMDIQIIREVLNMVIIHYPEYKYELSTFYSRLPEKDIPGFKNPAKIIYKNLRYQLSYKMAREDIYGYYEGSTNRFMNLLIIFGLICRPKSKEEIELVLRAFEANTYGFKKQRLYFGEIYFKKKCWNRRIYAPDPKERNNYIIAEIMVHYQGVMVGMSNENQLKIINDMFYFLDHNNTNLNVENIKKDMDVKIKWLNFVIKYPVQRKHILEKYNLSVHDFNALVKGIRDNKEYYLDCRYTEKIYEYLESKGVKSNL